MTGVPAGENLIAFDSRAPTARTSRSRSACTESTSSSRRTWTVRSPDSCASSAVARTASSRIRRTGTGAASTASRPESTVFTASRSSTRCCSCPVLRTMACSILRWRPLTGSASSSVKISRYPAMLVSGVRNSWETVAMKSLFALSSSRRRATVACSAMYASRSAASARRRSVMSWTNALNVHSSPSWTAHITSSMGNSLPSGRQPVSSSRLPRTFDSLVSRKRTRSAWSAARWRGGTSSSCSVRPSTSSRERWNMRSAAEFQPVIRPAASMETKPSIEDSITCCSRWRLFSSIRWACRRSITRPSWWPRLAITRSSPSSRGTTRSEKNSSTAATPSVATTGNAKTARTPRSRSCRARRTSGSRLMSDDQIGCPVVMIWPMVPVPGGEVGAGGDLPQDREALDRADPEPGGDEVVPDVGGYAQVAQRPAGQFANGRQRRARRRLQLVDGAGHRGDVVEQRHQRRFPLHLRHGSVSLHFHDLCPQER